MPNEDQAESRPSSLAGGRYAVIRQLGRGAQGQTLEAVDKLRGCLVAIKRFVIRGATEWKDVELAEREALVLSALSHPRLPRYVAHFEEEGCLYLVTEKIEGQPLDHWLPQGASMGRNELLRLLDDISTALEYLHTRVPPVIHRDIKPSNIIRCQDGGFMLVDFGSVRDRLRPQGGSTFVGTFGYMAPEQLQGRALPATDTYALGVTLIHLVTGTPPEDLPHRGLAIDVESSLGATLPTPWVRLLERMVEPDPERRIANVRPELHALGFASQPPPPTGGRGTAKPNRETRAQDSWWPPRGSTEGPVKPGRQPGVTPESGSVPDMEPFWTLVAHSPFWRPALVLLGIAELAVGIALHAIVPLVLTFLSLFFGAGLRRAARTVHLAGDVATAALREGSRNVRAETYSRRSWPKRRRAGRGRARVQQDRYRAPPAWPDYSDDAEQDARRDARKRRAKW